MKITAEFGKIIVDEKEYRDIIIIAGKVIPRDSKAIKAKHTTSHVIDEDEAEILLKDKPELVIIGIGFDGMAGLTPEAKAKIITSGAKLIEKKTPVAIEEFLNAKTKKKAALIHSTC